MNDEERERAERARTEREARLRARGFEGPTDEERRQNIADIWEALQWEHQP